MADRKCGKKQVVLDITLLHTDFELFAKLNEIYREHRGAWRALTVAKNLRLCKVSLQCRTRYDSCLAYIQQYRLFTPEKVDTLFDIHDLTTTMPHEDDEDFVYGCLPPQDKNLTPLLADDILWHFFCHPRGSIHSNVCDYECRNRLPKRTRPLHFCSNEGYPTGWGVEIVEGYNWRLFYHCESLIAVIALIFPCLWIVCAGTDDRVPTAFTIGQWMFGAGQVLSLLMLGLSEMLAVWRY